MNKNPAWLNGKKVAIVTDWLTTYGGAEKVVKTVHEIFPEAPIFTSQYSEKEVDWFRDCDVRTGWLNKFPPRLRKILGPLRLIYFSRLDVSDFDVVISIAISESKGIKTSADQLHISYLQGPPVQYYWGMYDDYVKNPGFGIFNPIVRFFFKLLVRPLKNKDYQFAQRPDVLVANSTYSAEEIGKYYHRQVSVVFPPVAIEDFQPKGVQGDYFITTSRQVNWKRLDVAVQAFLQTGQRLLLVGDGAEHRKLVTLAGDAENIEFIETVGDVKKLAELVSAARGFIFPSLEPFGIAPIEALSAGVPVIAYGRGGALDYVIDGENGIFFSEQTADSLVDALDRFKKMEFDETTITKSARKFSVAEFKQHFATAVKKAINEKR